MTNKLLSALPCSVIALILTACPGPTMAQESHSHNEAVKPQQEEAAATDQNTSTLLQTVRKANERFKDAAVAKAEGYALQFGCVSGDESGAMGMHFVNGDLVNKGILDPARPQIVIYEPLPDGSLKLIGVDFLVIADEWNKTHAGAPELMGQFFHLFTSPNRFGLPSFYTLHVWAWKENPNGAFVNWHPHVSCKSFTGQK